MLTASPSCPVIRLLFVLGILISSLQSISSMADDGMVFYKLTTFTGGGCRIPAIVAKSPEALANQAVAANNAATGGTCGGACTNPSKLLSVTGYYYVVQSICTGSRYQHPINRMINPKQPCDRCNSFGNPINVATGEKFQLEHDYQGPEQSGLRLDRLYSSNMLEYGKDAFGANWRHNYLRAVAYIEQTPVGNVTIPNPIANVWREDGRIVQFTNIDNKWVSDADVSDTLVRLRDAANVPIGWRYTNSNDETEIYDVEGKLLSITNRLGLTQTLTYDTSKRLTKVTDAFGNTLTFTYNTSSQIKTMKDPAGRLYTYTYGTNSNLVSVTYPDNKIRTYRYENTTFKNALTGIQDENGIRFVTWEYDTAGRAILSEYAGGADRHTAIYNADANGTPIDSTVTGPLGASYTRNLSAIVGVIKPTSQSQPGGSGSGPANSATNYDSHGNITIRTDFNGNQTRYTYHQARNLETVRVEGLTGTGDPTPDTRTTSTTWHPDWRLKVGIAEPLRLTTLVYNGEPDPSNGNAPLSCAPAGALVDGKPIAVLCKKIEQATTDADGSQGFAASPSGPPRIWSYTYNAFGRVLTADGPRTDVNDITTYTYYPETDPDLGKRGNLASLTDAAGNVTQYTAYDANGRLTGYTDPNGLVTTLTYDLRGRLTGVNRGGEPTVYTLDGVGQVTRATLPDASTISYTYDAAHRLTDVTDTLGNKVHYTLDAAGNRIAEEITDPAGTLTGKLTRIYDVLGRLQQLTEVQQ